MAHAFGVSGVIAEATVELRPAQTWTGLFASFPDLARAVAAGRGAVRPGTDAAAAVA